MRKLLKKSLETSIRFVSCEINGKKVDVPSGTTIYDASLNVLSEYDRIPTICHHPYLTPDGNCRICLVDAGMGLVPACITEVTEGMIVETNTPEVNENVRSVLKFMLSSHPLECPTCNVNGECDFQDLLSKYDVGPADLGLMNKKYMEATERFLEDDYLVMGNNALKLDRSKCLKCTRCIRACKEIQQQDILGMRNRGFESEISVFNDTEDFDLLDCIGCGQCTFVCPTGAIALNSQVEQVAEWLRLATSTGEVVVVGQTAPAVRVTVAEDLGLKAGAVSEGQMVAGMKELGFGYVFDTNFTADLTIMEEGYEFIGRVEAGGPFPMFTSCCPAWINMAEKVYPEYLPNLSSCKSPQQMLGSLIKDYWAGKVGVPRHQVRVVSIMPCTAKKDECVRQQMAGDVDVVLTTRELARLFKLHNVEVGSLADIPYDDPLGASTGAAVIFGATGGVMEAALRTAYEVITGGPLPDVNFTPVRGLEGIKEATVDVAGIPVRVAVVHQGRNIHPLMERIKNGEMFHFIEVMCCPGGCIGGGGNPKVKNHRATLTDRIDAIYDLDERNALRKSHENPSVIALYEDLLGTPNSHKAHELLHTHYVSRKK